MGYTMKNSPINKGTAAHPSPMRAGVTSAEDTVKEGPSRGAPTRMKESPMKEPVSVLAGLGAGISALFTGGAVGGAAAAGTAAATTAAVAGKALAGTALATGLQQGTKAIASSKQSKIEEKISKKQRKSDAASNLANVKQIKGGGSSLFG